MAKSLKIIEDLGECKCGGSVILQVDGDWHMVICSSCHLRAYGNMTEAGAIRNWKNGLFDRYYQEMMSKQEK